MAEDLIPMEIGYMNVIPKCLDSRGKYPVYENLPETYAAVNAFLTVSPLEGKYHQTCQVSELSVSLQKWCMISRSHGNVTQSHEM